MAPTPNFNALSQVKVAELSRCKQTVELLGSPLGKACYELDQAASLRSIHELRECGLLEAGLVYTSEVRPLEDRALNVQERRQFQTEIGCQPLLLTCLGCIRELERLRAAGAGAKEQKAVQEKTTEIVKLLVSNGAKIDQQDVGPLENMSLHLAASAGASKLLSLLLLLGADPSGVNSDGWTPEVLAKRSGHTTCQQILQVASMNRVTQVGTLEEDSKNAAGKENKTTVVEVPQQEMEQNILQRELGEADETPFAWKSKVKKEIAGVAYGPGGQWSLFDDDLHVGEDIDDADSLEYLDENELCKEDWASLDEEFDPEHLDDLDFDENNFESDDEDDHQVRAQVLKLRQENSENLKSLKELAPERTNKHAEVEHLEARAEKLWERLSVLRDRLQRRDAGDPKATEEAESEAQVGAWWEERATEHARNTWELTEQLAQLQQQHREEVRVQETQLRHLQRQSQGLEEYWAQLFEAENARETISRLGSEQHAKKLQREVAHLVGFQEKKQLPRVLRPRAAADSTTTDLELVPIDELLVSLEAHRRIHAAKAQFQTQTDELIEFCNERIADKHAEVEAFVEQQLLQTLLPKLGGAESSKAWQKLSALAKRAAREPQYEEGAASSEAGLAPASASGRRQRKRAPTPVPRGRPARATPPPDDPAD